MAGCASCFACNTLHCTAISEEEEGMVIDDIKIGFVEVSSGRSLSNRKSHSIGEPLAKRAGRNFNAWSI